MSFRVFDFSTTLWYSATNHLALEELCALGLSGVLASQERVDEAGIHGYRGRRDIVAVNGLDIVNGCTERCSVTAAHVQDARHRSVFNVCCVCCQLFRLVQHSFAVQWTAGSV